MRGDSAVRVKGTTDWQRFDTELEAPTGTRSVHLDLLTTSPNSAVAWFDGIEMERVASNLPEPVAPSVAAATPEGSESCLEVRWNAET